MAPFRASPPGHVPSVLQGPDAATPKATLPRLPCTWADQMARVKQDSTVVVCAVNTGRRSAHGTSGSRREPSAPPAPLLLPAGYGLETSGLEQRLLSMRSTALGCQGDSGHGTHDGGSILRPGTGARVLVVGGTPWGSCVRSRQRQCPPPAQLAMRAPLRASGVCLCTKLTNTHTLTSLGILH